MLIYLFYYIKNYFYKLDQVKSTRFYTMMYHLLKYIIFYLQCLDFDFHVIINIFILIYIQNLKQWKNAYKKSSLYNTFFYSQLTNQCIIYLF
jgi:hypothetical protein